MSEINGATRLYTIIGDPIAQVRSPLVFNALDVGRLRAGMPVADVVMKPE